MLTEKELYKIGVDPDNLSYPFGELNIIVQSTCPDEEDIKNGNELEINVSIFQPRKNRIFHCSGEDCIDIKDEIDKREYIKHLKDSAERLKILSYYLTKQSEEIEEFGYPKTNCYFPE